MMEIVRNPFQQFKIKYGWQLGRVEQLTLIPGWVWLGYEFINFDPSWVFGCQNSLHNLSSMYISNY